MGGRGGVTWGLTGSRESGTQPTLGRWEMHPRVGIRGPGPGQRVRACVCLCARAYGGAPANSEPPPCSALLCSALQNLPCAPGAGPCRVLTTGTLMGTQVGGASERGGVRAAPGFPVESPPGVPALARLLAPHGPVPHGVLLLGAAGGGPALPGVRGARLCSHPSVPLPGWRLLPSFPLHLLISAWASVGCSSLGPPSALPALPPSA